MILDVAVEVALSAVREKDGICAAGPRLWSGRSRVGVVHLWRPIVVQQNVVIQPPHRAARGLQPEFKVKASRKAVSFSSMETGF